jgi:hypothetical protein
MGLHLPHFLTAAMEMRWLIHTVAIGSYLNFHAATVAVKTLAFLGAPAHFHNSLAGAGSGHVLGHVFGVGGLHG